MSFEVRKMRLVDVPAVKELEVESGLSPWCFEDYEREMVRSDSIQLVSIINSEITGFILARLIMNQTGIINNLIFNQSEAEIYNIAVNKKYRRVGIGRELLNNSLKIIASKNISQVFLEVRESNQDALKFYVRNGFETFGFRKNFYSFPSEGAILMRALLDNSIN